MENRSGYSKQFLIPCTFPKAQSANSSFSYLPEGNSASIHIYTVQRDPRNFFPSPNTFLPERWLNAGQQALLLPGIFDNAVHNTDAFIPFSQGPASCVGKHLAYQEMRMVVCLLVRRFEMRFEDGYDAQLWEDELMDYFITLKGRLPIILTPRNTLPATVYETTL